MEKYFIGQLLRTRKGNHLIRISGFTKLNNGTYINIETHAAKLEANIGSGVGNPHTYKTERALSQKTFAETKSIVELSMEA